MSCDPFDPSADPALAALVPGLVLLDRFELIAFAGKGGMGVVWRARDRSTNQDVAMKFIPSLIASDSVSTKELQREAKRARDLTHPYICRVYDYGEDPKRCLAWISMEYLPGDNLTRRLRGLQRGFFSVEEIEQWTNQLCDALTYAHERAGLVHRDLKPSNLLLDAAGHVKVSDFGIAQTISESVTRLTGTMPRSDSSTSGTPLYMSPQQARGDRPRATDDLYSLGATLFELLTGRAPFYGGDINYQRQHVPAPSILDRRRELHQCDEPVPEVWEITIQRLLAKFPEHRPQSAREVAAALNSKMASSSVALGLPGGMPTAAITSETGRPKPSPSASATNLGKAMAIPPSASTRLPVYTGRQVIPPIPPLPSLGAAPKVQLPQPGMLSGPGHYPAGARLSGASSKKWHWVISGIVFLGLVLGGCVFAFLILGRNAARTLKVPGKYPTIQAAMEAAKPGEKVRVAPGTYREYIRLRSGVTLEGEDATRCVLEPADNVPSVIRGERVTGAKVEGFTIVGRGLSKVSLYALGFAYEETPEGAVKVKSIIPGSPASMVGLPVGAKLVSVDGEPVPYWENIVALTARHGAAHFTPVVFLDRAVQRSVVLTSHPRDFGGYFLQGIVLRESQADVTHCTIRGLPGPSIVVLGSSARGEVSGNIVVGCGNSGILVAAAGSALNVRRNTVSMCMGHGIEISGGSTALVTQNTARQNQQAGIATLRRESAPQILENICEENKWDGLLFQTGAGGTARGNQLRKNDGNGILASGDGTNPLITKNHALGNRKFGMSVTTGSRPQIAQDNQWAGNAGGTLSR